MSTWMQCALCDWSALRGVVLPRVPTSIQLRVREVFMESEANMGIGIFRDDAVPVAVAMRDHEGEVESGDLCTQSVSV